MSIRVNLSNFRTFYAEGILKKLEVELSSAHDMLVGKRGKGSEYTGWVELPCTYDTEEVQRIKSAAKQIQSDSDVLVVIGIGGSYLGARAAIEFLKSPNYNLVDRKGAPQIFFAGNNMSGEYIQEIVDIIGDRDFSINIISKSGTTIEPSIAFRIFREKLETKYGVEEASKRIYATTDAKKGALKRISDELGYQTFVIPDNIGGRYSVLTAVGLLPIAVSGIDINKILQGAHNAYNNLSSKGMDNVAWQYAAARNIAYRNGKAIEILGCYEPKFRSMSEWWKQLYGESEGKDGKGIFPASVDLTTDLHSLGQFIQDGTRNLVETIFTIEKAKKDITIQKLEGDCDRLNFLEGTSLDYINKQAQRGSALAHVDGGVPNIEITISEATEECFGELIYFFEFACGLSGYVMGINPFDQPGVEEYKKNMFALLGKPGYEERRLELVSRIEDTDVVADNVVEISAADKHNSDAIKKTKFTLIEKSDFDDAQDEPLRKIENV